MEDSGFASGPFTDRLPKPCAWLRPHSIGSHVRHERSCCAIVDARHYEALRGDMRVEDVSLAVSAGQVLALIGENGAGKSTLMKVLSGAHRPDAGRMQLDGQSYAPAGPHQARQAGVAMIYQELNLAPDLSVEDNIMLGQEERRGGILLRSRQRQRVVKALAMLGHPELRPETPVARLSAGARQLVEIARALVLDPKIIVFDEPTSSLSGHDAEHLFEVIARLRSAGLGVIYISHFLEEIRRVADSYAVLRDGRTVGSGTLANATEAQIVALMVGRSVRELFPAVPHQPGEEILAIENLSGAKLPQDVTCRVRRGEILGIAGLVGAGRTELMRCIFGLDAVAPRHAPCGGVHAGRLAARTDSGWPRAGVRGSCSRRARARPIDRR